MTKATAKKNKVIGKIQKVEIVMGGGAFKIEKGIPLPPKKKENPYIKVFTGMQGGDSFLIGKDEDVIRKVKAAATKYGKDNDATFAFRTLEEGVRCWRVK